ncbi:hypothetical protein EMO89_08465 [Bifidobacterium tissieri]|uniref:Uncharacterized protein n=1 Tax=Bifidobacterium tissieri TaxID=1630162 RepID=A0A5M9ZMH3_9BIFI|nr:hypothetical protein EMO89_08465 [Bifidobacterium tissieri]
MCFCPPGRLVVCLCKPCTRHSRHITGFFGFTPLYAPVAPANSRNSTVRRRRNGAWRGADRRSLPTGDQSVAHSPRWALMISSETLFGTSA